MARKLLAGSQAGVQVHSLPDLKPVGHDCHEARAGSRAGVLACRQLVGDRRRLAGRSGAVELWDWPATKLLATLTAGNDLAYDAAWRPRTASESPWPARIRQCECGACRRTEVASATLRPHSAAVLATLWLPTESLVLSAGVDQTIRLLDPASGQTLRSFDNHTAAVRDLALRTGNHDGPPLVASASADRTVRFWQPTIGRTRARWATLARRPHGDLLDDQRIARPGRLRRRPAAGHRPRDGGSH